MKRGFLKHLFLLLTLPAAAQLGEDAVSKGNNFYRQGQFDLAERQYKEALQRDETDVIARYNLGNALYQQKKFKEAADVMAALAENSTDRNIKSAAYYNKGVVHTKEKDLQKSIDAYKSALRLDPDDRQARENLQLALREQKQQQQKNQQQQQKPQSSMSQREAERKLKLLQDKEKELQQRLNKSGEKGAPGRKDW